MPELPEVETIRRTLEPLLADRTIAGAELYLAKALRGCTPEAWPCLVTGRKIARLERRGKHLIMVLAKPGNHEEAPLALVFHLRMTGQLIHGPGGRPRERHTTAVLTLDDGTELHFIDTRKFGVMNLIPYGRWDEVSSMSRLGPEPFSPSFTLTYFQNTLRRRKGKIKAVLLDQSVVAGLGNIYTDEALYRARIHPERMASSLDFEEVRRLYQAIKEVLQEGIAYRGTSVRDYADGLGQPGSFQERLAVYGRAKQACPSCGQPLARTVVAGRGTYFCPVCQRLEKEG